MVNDWCNKNANWRKQEEKGKGEDLNIKIFHFNHFKHFKRLTLNWISSYFPPRPKFQLWFVLVKNFLVFWHNPELERAKEKNHWSFSLLFWIPQFVFVIIFSSIVVFSSAIRNDSQEIEVQQCSMGNQPQILRPSSHSIGSLSAFGTFSLWNSISLSRTLFFAAFWMFSSVEWTSGLHWFHFFSLKSARTLPEEKRERVCCTYQLTPKNTKSNTQLRDISPFIAFVLVLIWYPYLEIGLDPHWMDAMHSIYPVCDFQCCLQTSTGCATKSFRGSRLWEFQVLVLPFSVYLLLVGQDGFYDGRSWELWRWVRWWTRSF